MTRFAQHPFALSFAHPRYWPTWFGIAVLWCLVHLPLPLQLQMGKLLGALAFRFAVRRRHIAAVNLKVCFPEADDAAHLRLLRATFRSTGIALFEIYRLTP